MTRESYVPWLDWEKAYLVEWYPEIGASGCAKILRRHTRKAIRDKANLLGAYFEQGSANRGDRNGAAKLSGASAAMIRARLGNLPRAEQVRAKKTVAEALGVSYRTVHNLMAGVSYRDAVLPEGMTL